MTGMAAAERARSITTADRPGETEAQRNDRNLAELLQELRVAAIGVQVIFGFLLSLPFYARFAALGHAQRVLYLVAVVLSAVSTTVLVTIFTVCLFGGLWFVYPLIRRRDWPTAESAPSVPALADAEPPAAHLTPPADDGSHMRDVETASSADRE